jgi:hypothetical protein
MIRETSQEEKFGTAILSAGRKYHRYWFKNGLLKRKCKGELYVERRGSGSDDG